MHVCIDMHIVMYTYIYMMCLYMCASQEPTEEAKPLEMPQNKGLIYKALTLHSCGAG